MRYDPIDWLTWILLAAAVLGACLQAVAGNFEAAFAWCMVGLVSLLTTLRSAQVDSLRARLRDRDVQVRHYHEVLYPLRDDLEPRRHGHIVCPGEPGHEPPAFLRRSV